MKHFLIAVQFLTIFPVKIEGGIRHKDFGASLAYFPVTGMLIGVVLALLAFALGSFPNSVKAAFVIILSAVITGGLHIDGLADTCDGFGSGRDRKEMLEIMRDSRIGAMGVTGVVSVLLAKFALIASMPLGCLWKSLIGMAVFSRWMQAFACYVSGYPRESGKAKFFIEHASFDDIVKGALFSLAVFLCLFKMAGFALFIFSFAVVLVFVSFVARKLGGMTGDTIGATNEAAELSVLLFALFSCGF